MMARRALFATLLTSLLGAAGCTSSLGFAVALSMHFEDAVTDTALGTVASLTVDIAGADTDQETYSYASLGRAARRTETTVYHPRATSGSLDIAVAALDTNGALVATGHGTAGLQAGMTTDVTIELDPPGTNNDAGVDAGTDGGTHDDLAGTDGHEDLAHTALTLSLQNTPTYPLSSAPLAIATGDLNHDGRSDAIIARANGIDVRLANADGTLANATTTPLTPPGTPSFVAVGDFDKDTFLDLAVALSGSSNILVFRGDGTGNLTAASPTGSGFTPTGLATADVDGDGHSDLVISGATSLAVEYSWTTTGQFLVTGLTNVGAVATGDVDGDGYIDIALGITKGNVTVYPNTTAKSGVRTWGTPVTSTGFPVAEDDVVVGKANGQSLLASSNVGSAGFCFSGSTYKCMGAGNVTYATGGDHGILVDIDGDGNDDWVFVRSSGMFLHGLDVQLYNSDVLNFSYNSPQLYATGGGPMVLASGDFNGDGRIDVLVDDQTTPAVSVFLNLASGIAPPQTFFYAPDYSVYAPPTIGDINGNQLPDIVLPQAGNTDPGANIAVIIDGAGTPGAPQNIPFSNAYSTALVDTNGDKLPDLVVGDDNATLTVFPNNGGAIQASGGVATVIDLVGAPTNDQAIILIASGDFNNDKVADVVFITETSPNVYVSLGTVAYEFSKEPIVLAVGSMLAATHLVVSDVDGDGQPDVIVSSSGYGAAVVFTQKTGSPGTFNAAAFVYSATNAQSVAVADFDQDGSVDLAVAGDNGVYLHAGTKGKFAIGTRLLTAAYSDVGATDLTNDGYVDLVAVSYATSQIVAFQNAGKSVTGLSKRFPTPLTYTVGDAVQFVRFGDFDSDGRTDILATNLSNSFFFVRNLSY